MLSLGARGVPAADDRIKPLLQSAPTTTIVLKASNAKVKNGFEKNIMVKKVS
jgi:hypothetical protein